MEHHSSLPGINKTTQKKICDARVLSLFFLNLNNLDVNQVQDVLKGSMAELQQSSLDKTLLSWCQEATKVINPHTKLAEWIMKKNAVLTIFMHDAFYLFFPIQDYAEITISNFTTSWSDGLAFIALIHRFRPDLFDYELVSRKPANARLEYAFRMANKHLEIARLLDPEGESYSFCKFFLPSKFPLFL